MVTYKLDRGEMDVAISALAKATLDIDATLDQLEVETVAKTADWYGQAIEAFKFAKIEWDKACVAMNEVLGAKKNDLQLITDGYGDVENVNRNSWAP
jgi:uncharacterized protein YukE